ncbi:hypothetical protein KXW98_001914 [Aspergillus fumigatus]|uniref:Azaphilone pigments biosynthesis cluster protein L N-terminal domain-containing protein n=1 Tax=Aspergillus fumigatus TaxID=746128 RepID=A0A229Y1J4_ASPFM|nr:hypothetical protein CNMCM8057_004285 [Aspergillus fumigatus]KAF4264239.1 hypothetical protein CNMCM8714_007632 [Aspergillus fumigatus]KAF4266206.1 hypothetical protein CNMCM8812_002802 [Aspergillus fumigatus]KAF4279649.1 hypothetical protein CNMCM8689_003117 [Aspergillus fumigatus]KAF4286811.1 hypothetical protein CNMCM8686_004351 [Aspergillus fumigatus]
MDGLSIGASVIGIATAAIQSVQVLARTIDNIKNVPDTIATIKVELQAVEPLLRRLNVELQRDDSQIILSNEIRFAVLNCDRACKAFRTLLDHWMSKSTDEKTFWMDRWRGTLNVALLTATTIATTRQENMMNELRDAILRQNEAFLQQEISRADGQCAEIQLSLQQVEASDNGQQNGDLEQSRNELLQEIRQQQASHDAFRITCEGELSRTVYERTGQKIKGVKATNHSSSLAGFINTSGDELTIDQDISDVTADNWSVAAAGVIKNLNFKDLRSTATSRQTP